MNLLHRWYCRSDSWARIVKEHMLPAILKDVDLGDNVIEIGPGPGQTTEWLSERAPRLTAVEIDPDLARKLRARMAATNVTVVEGDATRLTMGNDEFSGAVCFTMLHHVPSPELQDRLFSEVCRVLSPAASSSAPTARQAFSGASCTSPIPPSPSIRRRFSRG